MLALKAVAARQAVTPAGVNQRKPELFKGLQAALRKARS